MITDSSTTWFLRTGPISISAVMLTDTTCVTGRMIIQTWSSQSQCIHRVSPFGLVCGQEDSLGHFFFNDTVTGERYLNMFNNDVLPSLLEMSEFNENQLIWQQDGAPPHWYRPARTWLDNHFGQRWIGRNGPTAWPPRSPDLTVCDFWLWGHVKQIVYRQNRPENIGELKERIREITDEQRLHERHCRLRSTCATLSPSWRWAHWVTFHSQIRSYGFWINKNFIVPSVFVFLSKFL